MCTARDRPESIKDSGIRSTYPLVKIKAAVSAMARPSPRMAPTRRPGIAAGKRMVRIVVGFERPRAAADNRCSLEMARKLSSAVRIKIGNTMQAKVRPPDKIENPNPKVWQNRALPNSPKTIDGTPASTSSEPRISRPRT